MENQNIPNRLSPQATFDVVRELFKNKELGSFGNIINSDAQPKEKLFDDFLKQKKVMDNQNEEENEQEKNASPAS